MLTKCRRKEREVAFGQNAHRGRESKFSKIVQTSFRYGAKHNTIGAEDDGWIR